MSFLSLSSAWFALALPAIAAMYILKRTYTDKEIASHLLWRKALNEHEANRPWQKLRSRLLLILQLLAALLIVLALMQPVVMRPYESSGHAVIIMDRSGSMALRPSSKQGETGSKISAAVNEAMEWLESQPDRKPVTVIATGKQPDVLISRTTDRDELIKILHAIEPTYGPSDNTAALSLADSLLDSEPDGEIVIFTDGQWTDAAEANALELQSKAKLFVTDSGGARDNQSILYFGIKSDQSGSGANIASVTVNNDSANAKNVQIDIYVINAEGKSTLALQHSLQLPAGGWDSVQTKELPDGAYYKAELHRWDDDLSADNAAYQFPAISRDKQALLVTDGNLFLEKALQLAGIQTVKISSDQAAPSGESADNADWIVLDGSYEQLLEESEWAQLLERKALWIIDHPSDADGQSAVPATGRVEAAEHPVTTYISLNDTHIGRLAQPPAGQLDWGKPILTYGGVPAIYAGESDGRPRLRFTFNLQDTDLPLKPEFPILVVQAAEWMSGGSQLELGGATAEQELALSFHSNTEQASWEAVEVADRNGKSIEASITSVLDLTAASSHEAPAAPGLYRLVERNGEKEIVSSRLLAVHTDAAEISGAFGELMLSQTTGEDESVSERGPIKNGLNEQAFSLAVWAAALLLLLMAAEWEVYRRGHTS